MRSIESKIKIRISRYYIRMKYCDVNLIYTTNINNDKSLKQICFK